MMKIRCSDTESTQLNVYFSSLELCLHFIQALMYTATTTRIPPVTFVEKNR